MRRRGNRPSIGFGRLVRRSLGEGESFLDLNGQPVSDNARSAAKPDSSCYLHRNRLVDRAIQLNDIADLYPDQIVQRDPGVSEIGGQLDRH